MPRKAPKKSKSTKKKSLVSKAPKIPCGYDEFMSLTGVVIIPIKGKKPVLIFKDYGAPFYLESGFDGQNRRGFEQKVALNNYLVYWEGKFLNHDLPKVISREYGNFFDELIESNLPTYLKANDFPRISTELPIPLLANEKFKISINTKIKSFSQIELTALNASLNYTKISLRDLKFIAHRTGKIKPVDEVRLKRDRLILEIFQKFKKKSNKGDAHFRIPIKTINDAIDLFLRKEFPKKKPDRYLVSDTQVWRIIDRHNRRQKEAEEWLRDNVPA